MTYPSGLTLDFQYDANGRVSGISSGGQTLVANVAYKPFGPVKSMDLGPLVLTRTYDQRYKITGIQAGTVLNYGYTHDGAGNVETISGLPNPDFFPRLTDLTYNANRMATQNTDFISGIPIYSPAAVYAYDAAGNIVSDGLHTDYFYNQNNRLIRVEIDGLTVAEYAYDAFERRVMKVVNGVRTHFLWLVRSKFRAVCPKAGGNMKPAIRHSPRFRHPPTTFPRLPNFRNQKWIRRIDPEPPRRIRSASVPVPEKDGRTAFSTASK
jgi:YD repeat-containing protein